MLVASISEAIESAWSKVEPVRFGCIPAGLGTPARYVTVTDGDVKLLRIDVYDDDAGSFTFEDAIVWQKLVVVGYGSHVHAVSLTDRTAVTIPLGSYYGHVYSTDDYLLVASGERLFRIEPDASVAWRSDVLGIDGVIVSNPGPPNVGGEGEWDPPGGWEPFTLLASTGRRTA